jgi:hypothetical protein
MKPGRIKQRIVHTIDNIGGRDIPHAIIHLQDAKKAPTLKETKDHIDRALGHIKEASNQSGMLSEAIKTVPGIMKEANRLAVEQSKSDGLVKVPPKPKKDSVTPSRSKQPKPKSKRQSKTKSVS